MCPSAWLLYISCLLCCLLADGLVMDPITWTMYMYSDESLYEVSTSESFTAEMGRCEPHAKQDDYLLHCLQCYAKADDVLIACMHDFCKALLCLHYPN